MISESQTHRYPDDEKSVGIDSDRGLVALPCGKMNDQYCDNLHDGEDIYFEDSDSESVSDDSEEGECEGEATGTSVLASDIGGARNDELFAAADAYPYTTYGIPARLYHKLAHIFFTDHVN